MPISDDKEIWQFYTGKVRRGTSKKRTSSSRSKNLAGIKKSSTETKISERKHLEKPELPSKTTDKKPPHDLLSYVFDRRTERKVRDGLIELDARLDLHGMTQKEAYQALQIFIKSQIKLRRRKLLIITGKGPSGQGVLRTGLLGWLESLPYANFLLSVRQAAPRHGGGGAFYVMLRYPKEELI